MDVMGPCPPKGTIVSTPPLRRLATWLAVPIVGVAAALAGATPSQAAVGCSASFQLGLDWDADSGSTPGFFGDFTVTNTGDTAMAGWQISATFAPGVVLHQWWNVDLLAMSPARLGNKAHNGALSPGSSTSFGIHALKSPAFPQLMEPAQVVCAVA
jgi:hypothetical protein